MDMRATHGFRVPNRTPDGVHFRSGRSLRVALYSGLILTDCASIILAFIIAGQVRFGDAVSGVVFELVAVLIPLYIAFAVNAQAYTIDVLRNWQVGASRGLRSLLFSACAIFLTAFLLKTSEDISRILVAVGFIGSAVLLVLGRKLFDRQVERRVGRSFVRETVILDGRTVELPTGAHAIDARAAGITPDTSDPIMLDRLSRLLQFADRVVVACPTELEPAWASMLKGMDVQGEVWIDRFQFMGVCGIGKFAGHPTAIVSSGPLSLSNRILKRGLDIALTLPALIFLAPSFLLIALLIKLDSPGPVFFKQERMGCGNRLFSMYKFRTMHADRCDARGHCSTSRHDDRVTRIGRFLRRTSIDELPQLFNVLLGSMSLVGPRPHALGSTAGESLFWQIDPCYWHRHTLKPGITGLAQIRGYRGATTTSLDLTRRLQADLEYVSTWSLAKDISILIRTFGVLVHHNAY